MCIVANCITCISSKFDHICDHCDDGYQKKSFIGPRNELIDSCIKEQSSGFLYALIILSILTAGFGIFLWLFVIKVYFKPPDRIRLSDYECKIEGKVDEEVGRSAATRSKRKGHRRGSRRSKKLSGRKKLEVSEGDVSKYNDSGRGGYGIMSTNRRDRERGDLSMQSEDKSNLKNI